MRRLRRSLSVHLASALAITTTLTTATAQTTTLVPASAVHNDSFGGSVDIEGSLCVAGARYHDSAGQLNSGGASVFERTAQGWIELAELSASDAETQDFFGSDVAIDGDTVLVGAENEGNAARHYGAAYVFVRNGAQWTEQAKLVTPLRVHASLFGDTVALSGDTAVIGAPQDSSVSSLAGSVDVFVRTGTTWTHQAHLEDTTSTNQAAFGYDVAIDGDTLLIGAASDDAPLYNSGSVYAFTRAGSVWTSQGKFSPTVPVSGLRFGAGLALQGNRAAIGTYALPGSVYVFEFIGGAWSEQALLQPIDPQSTAGFGSLLALDGERIAVGAVLESAGLVGSAGAAYLFEHSGAAWTVTQHLVSPTPAVDDGFCFVGLDGATLAVGEYHDGPNIGAVHMYELGALATYCTAGTTTNGCTPHIWLDGTPRASGIATAILTTSGVQDHAFGLIFAGTTAIATPWSPASTSFLCVQSPVARIAPPQSSGGTLGQCNGVLTADINAYLQANGLVLGQPVFSGTTLRAQAWFRDPAAPNFTNLSDALAFTFYP